MEENEQLEQAGNKVTAGDTNQNGNTDPKHSQTEQDAVLPYPDQKDASLASDGPVSESKGDDSKPDLNDIKKNPDPEPGVPDQDF